LCGAVLSRESGGHHMALVCFAFLVFERTLEMYWATFQSPEPTVIILEEELSEPPRMAA
jgi:hypothetical protein